MIPVSDTLRVLNLFLTDSPICQSCLIPNAYSFSSVRNIYRVSVLLDELQIIDDVFLNCFRLPDNRLSSNVQIQSHKLQYYDRPLMLAKPGVGFHSSVCDLQFA